MRNRVSPARSMSAAPRQGELAPSPSGLVGGESAAECEALRASRCWCGPWM